eukprot:4776157-Amphidinium_carterae.9
MEGLLVTPELLLPSPQSECGKRRVGAGKVKWPLSEVSWEGALSKGRGRGPVRNFFMLSELVAGILKADAGIWRAGEQNPGCFRLGCKSCG